MIPSSKRIYLCSPDASTKYPSKICVLNGVQTGTVDFHPQIKGYSELSFDVDRYISIDGQFVESNGYEYLKPYMYLYLEDIGYFIMEPPVTNYDGTHETKQIVAYSAEKEFESRDWVGIKINTGESDSLEYANTDESNKDSFGFAVRYVTMLDQQNKDLSFLHLILQKMSTRWSIQYVSPKLTNAKIPWLEVDNENLYAVMTSEVGPRMSCLFVFDYLNFGINVYHKDELDYDTGIFIGFRNLQNSVSVNVDSDSIFTRFTVKGDGELEFRDVNYGDNTVINLDYFLGEPYMDEEMVQKYRQWQAIRENNVDDYVALVLRQLELTERRYERVYRVPSDEAYWSNWENVNEEGLEKNLEYFRNQMELLQISVEPVAGRTEEDMYDDNGNYVPKMKTPGTTPYVVDGLKYNHTYIVQSKSDTTVALKEKYGTGTEYIIDGASSNINYDDAMDLLNSYDNRRFGNIDLTNRQALHWTQDYIDGYQSVFDNWRQRFPDFEEPELGDISTVFGCSDTFSYNYGGQQLFVTIAYTPLAQTSGDVPVFMLYDTLEEYIYALLDKSIGSNGVFDEEAFMRYDAIGLSNEWDGSIDKIRNMIARVEFGRDVESVHLVGELMHLSEVDEDIEAINKILGLIDMSIDDFNLSSQTLAGNRHTIITGIKNAKTSNIYVSLTQMQHCGYPTELGAEFLYKPTPIEELVDHEPYLQALYDQVNVYGGYYTYKEIKDYIIPYILLAYDNIDVREDEKQKPEYEIANDWTLYGLEELKGVRDSYIDKLKSLEIYSKDWDDMTDEEKARVMLNYADDDSGEQYEQLVGRKEYVKYKTALGDEQTSGTILYQIKQIEDEIAQIDDEIAEINLTTDEYAKLMKYNVSQEDVANMTHLSLDLITERLDCAFTEREMITFMSLLKDTDYVNSNIVATSIFSVDQQIEAEKELFADATDKLSEVSQPQYTFSISMDNFFRIPEYETWKQEFEPDYTASPNDSTPPLGMLKFIRVSLRDDFIVKLRVIGYRWNPCEVTPELSIDFSNMITGRSGRSDLTQLLEQENNRGSKNGIKIGNGSAESAQEYCNALMELLKNNSIFLKSVRGIASGVTGALDIGTIQGIVAQSPVPIMNVIGTSEQLAEFITKNITDNALAGLSGTAIATKVLEADQGFFNTLTTEVLRIGKDGITEITKDTIKTETINAKQIVGESGDFDTLATRILEASDATINNLIATKIDAAEINVSKIIGDSGEFKEFFVNHLNAQDADIQNLIAQTITTDSIAAKLGNFTQANVNTLFANNAFIDRLLSQTSTTITDTVNTSYIRNAIIGNLSVGELAAGDITLSDTMRIVSENGHLVMNGQLLQISGKDSQGNDYVGIQLGYDTQEQPSLVLRNEQGATVLTPQGITENAIADGLIVNNMIQDSTISREKIGFDFIEPNEYGGIDIGHIYNGDGGKFGQEWTTFTQETRTALENLQADNNYIELKGDQIFKEIDGEITPDQITINAITRGGVVVDKWYVDGIENTDYVSYDKASITIPSDAIENWHTLTVKVSSTTGLFDLMTLYRIADGANGESPYTVVITSSNGQLFNNPGTTLCECTVYHGVNEIIPLSYAWMVMNDNDTEWQTVGTERYLTINVQPSRIRKRIKCQVEI